MIIDFNFYDIYVKVRIFCISRLIFFLIGSNWILHIISELIFADSKKKFEYPEFPVLECGDPEKYKVGTKQPLNLQQIIASL